MWGNDGVNIFDGGVGADIMNGFGGNDSYFVDNAGDVVVESAGGGSDLVYTSVDYTLASNVERLGVNGFTTTFAVNLSGNGLDNEMWGNDGANTLDGRGGADILQGNSGADSFAFTTALGGGTVDNIVDLVSGLDKIALHDAVFTGLGVGLLSPNVFVPGTSAQDADDRIIYNSSTDALYFDADGNGAGTAVEFATLSTGLNLAAGNFVVV